VHVTVQAWPEATPVVLKDDGQRQLGLQMVAAENDKGVMVASVDPIGTAADSGIQKGDIIVEIQQTPVSDPQQASELFAQQADQRHHFAAVLVERDKKLSWIPLAIPN
jgi:S1-C subfamily serine protease